MKVNYRGFEIEANREESLAGYDYIYYSIYREGYCIEESFQWWRPEENVRAVIKYLKKALDDGLYDDAIKEADEDSNTV